VAIRTTLNVSLTAELGQFIDRQIDAGRYRTASELVRASLRLLQELEEPKRERITPAVTGKSSGLP
jgi:antitoxin ParD1/3/4